MKSSDHPSRIEPRGMPSAAGSLAVLVTAVLVAAVLAGGATARGQSYLDPPISYESGELHDPIARLQERIDSGETALRFEKRFGYLRSLLEELDIPVSSQVLVFSKTSFQLKRISPRSPRALYFNDDVYVGRVRGGEVLEIASVDPRQGTIFYLLEQKPAGKPHFERRTFECTSCHASPLTRGVPGVVVRSVYPGPDGTPIFRAGTYVTDDASPMGQRWGGWYVTGSPGKEHHLGNHVYRDRDKPMGTVEPAGKIVDLSTRFDVADYLTPHSDIVALMVLEHQTQMHNLITRAGFETRRALFDQRELQKLLDEPDEHLSASTRRRIERAATPLVEYMLFTHAARFRGPILGSSRFAKEFTARGPRDSRGRSLRDLDLGNRLFRYPCSFLIYSEAFDSLPEETRSFIYRRLWEILTGEDTSDTFAHLSAKDRRAVLEILLETKKGLPASWRPAAPKPAPRKARKAEL